MEKLMGVVITYYPNETIKENIDSYLSFIDELVIVDNTPGDSDLLKKLFLTNPDHPSVSILFNGENRGIASALNQGVELARQKKYDWVLTMDQDSRFTGPLFFEEFGKFKDHDLAVFAPGNTASNNYQADKKKPVRYPQIVMTSGSILNLSIWEEIGRFNESLFIDEVDHDYCLRALMRNKRIVQVNQAILEHHLGKNKLIRLPWIKRYIHFHSPERTYYIFRNNFYMFSKYSGPFSGLMKKRKLILIKDLLTIILFSPQKLKHLKYARLGILDFHRGIYGPIRHEVK
jgi:rhamnosyltransferase